MKKTSKIVLVFLAVITLLSVLAIPAFAEIGYPMNITIYYKNESGAQVAPTLTTSINAAATNKPTWTSPTVSGYVLKDSGDSVVTYAMLDKTFPTSHYVRHGSGTYTVYYTDQGSKTVYYRYNHNGVDCASPKTYTGKIGSSYTITSPTITGYTPSSSVISGTITSASSVSVVRYMEKSYTVSFDANGGTGAPSSQTKWYFKDLTLSSTIPTRTGYNFAGWGLRSISTSASYNAGGKYSSNISRTLYAVWSPKTYTISYNANGGIGAPGSQTKYYNQALTLSIEKPVRDGYTFNGWATTSTGSALYSPGETYTANASRTFYASWTKNVAKYTVSYNANGGTGAPASQTKIAGRNLTLSSTIPTRSGYTFMGWGRSSSSTVASYAAGGIYTIDASTTLYAVWSRNLSTYTVSYHANGGSGAPASQTKTEDVTLTLSSTRPTRSGYSFLGWSASSTASYATYSAGGSYTANASVTLYAVWSKNTSYYTVSYNANGGTGAPSSQTKTENVTLTLSNTRPTRSGYTFLGWSASSSATSPSYYPGGSYTANASRTLYAVWERDVSYYTVSYYANGGSGAPASQTKIEDVTLTLSSTSPTRSGYTFVGWATSSNANTASYYPGSSFSGNYNLNLYAVWNRNLSSYTISYNANGGTGAPASQTKIKDTSLTLSSTIPAMLGYTFLGWSTSSTASSPTYYAGGIYSANAGATLYAVWSRDTFTVSYNANGGTDAPTSQTKYYDQNLTLTSSTPTRDSYTFLGWSESATATSPTYYAGSIYESNSSTILYAVWQIINYDFSVSELEITPDVVTQYESVNVYFQIDSWDRYNPYSDIPVEVLLNGRVIYSTTVDIAAYGVKYVDFNLNVGASEGTQSIVARVNWSDHESETRTGNNSVSTTFHVKKAIETSVEPVAVSGEYIEGMDVMTSFYIRNEGSSDVTPADNLTFTFKVYSTEETVFEQTKSVVVPSNGTNLVYFKWTVPENSAGTAYWCNGRVSVSVGEQNTNNNSTEFAIVSASLPTSTTPNTRYEEKPPASYNPSVTSPTEKAGSASWNEWVYENGSFVLKNYGITVSNGNPVIAPSVGCETAIKDGAMWKMGSGYGVSVSWTPSIRAMSGKTMPESGAYTGAQSVYATFPEYSYSLGNGRYDTLENVGGAYMFKANPDADRSERIHFIPVYVSDGRYSVSVSASYIWTPAGMITATRNATVIIDGTIYDDWYQG